MNLDMEKMWTSTLFGFFIEKYTFSFQIYEKKDKVKTFPKPSISYKASNLPIMHIKSIFFWITQIVGYNSICKFITYSWQMKITNYMACPMSQCLWLWFKTHLVMSNKEVSQITHIYISITWICNVIDRWL